MAWRDELRPASFRGVSFYVEGGTLTLDDVWPSMSTRSARNHTSKTLARKLGSIAWKRSYSAPTT